MKTWEVYIYDTWGNEVDGFNVNNVYWNDRFPCDDAQDPIEAMRAHNLLTGDGFEFEWSAENWCEISDSENGKPLGRIVAKQ